MRANPIRRLVNEMKRLDAVAAQDAATQAQAGTDSASMGAAGAVDSGTGEWAGYGLLDVTRFGDGFRLR